ncbi:MAG: CHC2 zinc finger domain-containing protein, partial [Candidatus Tectomicrobia bacterium]
MSSDAISHENATLTETALAACRPVHGEGDRVLRALCPFHGSDQQRSLRVTLATGRFQCFACGAWGYLEEARQRWRDDQQRQAAPGRLPANIQMYALHIPGGEREAGRPARTTPIYEKLTAKGCVHTEAFGWERPKWFSL